MFANAWLPVCMSARMHGFGVRLVFVTSIGKGEDVVGLDSVCLQKMVESRSCDLSVGMNDFLGNSQERTRALHSNAAHVGLLHASLAVFRALQAVPVAGLLLTSAGYSLLPWGSKKEKRKGKVLIVVGKQSLSRHRIHLSAFRV